VDEIEDDGGRKTAGDVVLIEKDKIQWVRIRKV